ncbi:kinase-like protein [Coprinellus micaceus]|uniref:Kinase-like protein n=1 Tax=Coprinellus micaceus TaxID=71717 RepID=A0A4Y7SYK0_COPMI|nr:kinase-like protein [Coprinellus micaceus]
MSHHLDPTPPDLSKNVILEANTPHYATRLSYVWIGNLYPGDVQKRKYSSKDAKLVAIKVIHDSTADNQTTNDPRFIAKLHKRVNRESRLWFSLSHPNILPILGLASRGRFNSPIPAYVMPFCRNGNALAYVQKNPSAPRLPLIRGVADGLGYLHSQNIVHGDLKAANIMISSGDHRALISDFGSSKILKVKGFTTNVAYSWKYLAIELMIEAQNDRAPAHGTMTTHQSDVWAFGMVCGEIVGGSEVFVKKHQDRLVLYLDRGGRPTMDEFPNIAKKEADKVWKILEACWVREPSARPSMSGVIGALSRIK